MPLKPLPAPVQEPDYGSDSPVVECEACGKKGPSHLMINLLVNVTSPGHPKLPGIGCPVEHWSCSRECWLIVAHACIDEHMHALLKEAHQSVGL